MTEAHSPPASSSWTPVSRHGRLRPIIALGRPTGGLRGDGRHRVAVLARDGVLPFELSIVHRLFGQARSAGGAAFAANPGAGRPSGN